MRPLRLRHALLLAFLAAVVLTTGCPAPEDTGRPAGKSTAAGSGTAKEEALLQLVKMDDLKQMLQGHPGKVVVVDIWAET